MNEANMKNKYVDDDDGKYKNKTNTEAKVIIIKMQILYLC